MSGRAREGRGGGRQGKAGHTQVLVEQPGQVYFAGWELHWAQSGVVELDATGC